MPTQEDRADLSSAIMNIPCNPPGHPDGNVDQRLAYRVGHRDARHAAAELALAARSTDPEGERSIIDTYVKLHEGKIGAHWLWCVIEQIAAGVPEPEAMRAYGYYEPAATSAATPEPSGLTASVSVPRELLREARDNCEATLAETDISAFRKEYRMELLARLDAALSASARAVAPFDLIAHIQRAKAFSEKTFGPGARSKGVVAHIRKELLEIEANPSDLTEWVDVMILAMDGAWRAGHSPESICAGIVAKQTKNEGRTWPDWRTASPDGPIEHDRSCDAFPATPTAPMEPAAAPDAVSREFQLLQVENAGLQSSVGHLGALVDELRGLTQRCIKAMGALHSAAEPDESTEDIDARIPGHDFASFVNEHAAMLQAFAHHTGMSTSTQQATKSAAASENYDEVKATLQGLHTLCESISGMERRVGTLGSHARGFTHKITNALRHLDALAAKSAAPAAVRMGTTVDGYLCRAWGESDEPIAEMVPDLEGVASFMIECWLGDEGATDYDGTLTLPRLKEEWRDRDWKDEPKWFVDFEIGGVSVEKMTLGMPFAAPMPATQAPAAARPGTPGPWFVSPDGLRICTDYRDSLGNSSPENYTRGGHVKVIAYLKDAPWRTFEQRQADAKAIASLALSAPTPTGASMEPVADGGRWIKVNGTFDALMLSLERADRKGYMPDALADEWEAFDWDEAASTSPTTPEGTK